MNDKYYRISSNEFLGPKWSVVYIFDCSIKETLLYSNYFNENTIDQALHKKDGFGSQVFRDYYNHIINNIEGDSIVKNNNHAISN